SLDPQTLLWVGKRDLTKRPDGWMIFFDRVNRQPYANHLATLRPRSFRVTSRGASTTVIVDGLSAESFTGDFRFTVYPGSRLIHTEAVLSTQQDAKAILYDTGLATRSATLRSLAYMDNHDHFQRVDIINQPAGPVATRYRTVIAEGARGSVAAFPAPHQYFYPLDYADNFGFNFFGANYQGKFNGFAFGIRQPPEGDHRLVPWINAPPGTRQHLSAFYLLSETAAEQTLERVKRYTHADRFPALPGYKTFSSHYHVEHALDYLQRFTDPYTKKAIQDVPPPPTDLVDPGFVKTFKRTGVDIVHLAEFHRGPTKRLDATQRLNQLDMLHAECRRLSNDRFLLLPGEEPNAHLGGHWISFFPKPIDWVLNRPDGAPFVQTQSNGEKLYHVGSPEDVLELMRRENGLMWTAHARIKGSTGFPDDYKDQAFFKSDRFLGAAFKAMPADLSRQTLGWRVLDLLDDMNNWGDPKFVIGEVDVFKVNPDYELYGHMNINYLRLDKIPRYDDGWQPVLDTLRDGAFFVTTGEILIPRFDIGGAESGQTLQRKGKNKATLTAELNWTFPLRFATVLSGDGQKIYRQRVDLSDTRAFDGRTLTIPVNIKNRKWVRLEVWDVAANGAYTQPVRLEP
ncbi:MAG: CehA/McbA family metallohydrolase domain-containing protein, partial [Planctomycetota bacterium]